MVSGKWLGVMKWLFVVILLVVISFLGLDFYSAIKDDGKIDVDGAVSQMDKEDASLIKKFKKESEGRLVINDMGSDYKDIGSNVVMTQGRLSVATEDFQHHYLMEVDKETFESALSETSINVQFGKNETYVLSEDGKKVFRLKEIYIYK